MKETTKNKAIRTDSAVILLGEDGILHVEADEHETIEMARKNKNTMQELSAGKKRPALVDITRSKSIERKARLYYASEETAQVLRATAFLVDSPVSKVLASFFLGINKPPYPIKMFTTKEEALQWLKGFLE